MPDAPLRRLAVEVASPRGRWGVSADPRRCLSQTGLCSSW